MFPSPCGDVVLKLISSRDGNITKISQFPSPCGDVVLKYDILELFAYRVLEKFPSPCGDVVLKSLRLEALLCLVQNGTLRRGCVSPPFCVDDAF